MGGDSNIVSTCEECEGDGFTFDDEGVAESCSKCGGTGLIEEIQKEIAEEDE